MSIVLVLMVAASVQAAPSRPDLSEATGAAFAALETCIADRGLYLEPSGEDVDRIIRVATGHCAAARHHAEVSLSADLRSRFSGAGQEDRAERMTADILRIHQRIIEGDVESKIIAARADRRQQTAD